MDRGTYASASAGMKELSRLEIVNNNLANVNTPGFKRQFLITSPQSFEDTLAASLDSPAPYAKADHERTPGVQEVKTVTDFSLGSFKNTGNPLDVALRNPKDFFVIQTPDGDRYTRAGNFTLNEEGQISTVDGYPVSGDGGAIQATGAHITVTNGGVVQSDGQEVGRLRVVHFEDTAPLVRHESSRFELPAGNPAPEDVDDPSVISEALEMSNVSAIQSVIELIGATRGFELYTKSAKSIDEMNNIAITQVGRKT